MIPAEYQSRPVKHDGVEHWYTFDAQSFGEAIKKAQMAVRPGHNQLVHGHREGKACRDLRNPVNCVTLRMGEE